jgi:hypothetical protein
MAGGEPGALEGLQQLQTILGLIGESHQKCRNPHKWCPRRVGAQCRGRGERDGRAEQVLPRPEADQRGAARPARRSPPRSIQACRPRAPASSGVAPEAVASTFSAA